ncbi:uncharacterized protein LOC125294845 isoform X2 [Alosa alosa]|uniref:uncharacterized protein LOC125294845 isoform X2 n=1 Tax=Alosa alosa TaxID=278164 RepID=UPI0020151889|nr:uncharacterized protein LOC125294845 isoform X2 [Alosa alosa]
MRKAELTLKERPLRSWGERQRGESPKHHDREGQENDSSHSNTGHRPEELRQGQENDPSHSNRGRRPEELREGPHVNQSRGGTRERPQSCMERRRGRGRPLGNTARAGGWRLQPSRPNTAPPDGNSGLTSVGPAVSTPEPPRCRAIWTGPALRGGARAVDGRQVLEPGDDQARPPPSLHLYLPCPNEPEGGRERPAEGGQLTEERCPQGEARNKRCSRHRCQAATT